MYASTPEEIREFQERIRAQNPEAKCVGIWEPNPCWYCSGSIVNGKHVPFHRPGRGTGQDPLNPELPCPHCSVFVDANPGRKLEACLGYGPQMLALQASDFEVGIAGCKGWGKSDVGTIWLIKGNMDEPLYDKRGQPILVNHSYGYHSDYRAFVMRQNRDDLKNWISFAEQLLSTAQPRWTFNTSKSAFISEAGAYIFMGHLADSSSWEHITGQPQLHRVWIDEASQIPFDLYEHMLSSMRSKHNELRNQILLSWNWIGTGVGWLRERFLEERQYDGKLSEVGRSLTYILNTKAGKRYRTRLLVTGGLRDNPKIGEEYEMTLQMMKDPKKRKAFLDGDPYAWSGAYFCCDSETEIWTKDGFKKFPDVSAGDPIATTDDNGRLLFVPVEQVHSYDYSGDLITSERTITNFSVTPNHRMYCSWYNAGREKAKQFCDAADMPSISRHWLAPQEPFRGEKPQTVTISGLSRRDHELLALTCIVCGAAFKFRPQRMRHRRTVTCSQKCACRARSGGLAVDLSGVKASMKKITLVFDAGDWMEFLGWYLSEGCINGRYRNSDGTTSSRSVIICQQKEETRGKIRVLLSRMGLAFGETKYGFRIHSTVLAKHLEKFGLSHEKYIPREYLESMDSSLLRRLFEALMLGDGCVDGRNGYSSYYSVSVRLANDVQELCLRLGMAASLNVRPQKTGRSHGYYVGIRAHGRNTILIYKDHLERRQYSGRVHCVSAPPYGRIFIRRGGRVLCTGNSDLFRPKGPNPGEPRHADHVVLKSLPGVHHPPDVLPERVEFQGRRHKINRATGYPELSPYWPRAIGGDWGYAHDAAFHWGCQNPETKQLHIYREHGVNRTTARQLGIQVASLCSDELEHLPGHAMTLYFSPDAFSKLAVDSGPRCYADMLAAGIGEVLGPDAVWVPESELKALEERRDELVMGDTEAYETWKKAFLAQQKKGITIRKANNDRVLGAMRFRELMIWENPHAPLGVTFDWDTYIGILHEKGELEARKYAAQFQRHDGVYPRLQIWDCCERLIEVLPKLVHQDDTKIGANPEDVDKSHIPGMDFYDSGRHIVLAFAEQKWVAPLEEQRRAMVEQYRRQNPSITTQELIWAQQRFDAQHAQDGGNVVRIGRESGDQGRSLRLAQRKMLQ